MSKQNQSKIARPMIVAVAVVAALIGLIALATRDSQPGGTVQRIDHDDTRPGVQTGTQSGDPSAETGEQETAAPTESQKTETLDLGKGLYLSDFGGYTGIYMEDGTNEAVSGVMMLILHNSAKEDLQYAKFSVKSGTTQYEFEATNVAAGERVVLLEKNREMAPSALPESAEAEYIVFFDEPMDVCVDVFEITGMDGALNVRNISDTDITADIYVYYKYCSEDLLYGGITFRALVSGGLSAGEIRQISTAHYDDGQCCIVQVVYGD